MSGFQRDDFGLTQKKTDNAELKEKLNEITNFGPLGINPLLQRDPIADRLRRLKESIDELHNRVDKILRR